MPIRCTCSFRQRSGANTASIEAHAALDPQSLDPHTHGTADVVLDGAGNLTSVQFDGPIFGTVFEGSFLRDKWGPIPGGWTGSFELTGTASVLVPEPSTGQELFSVQAGPAWWEPEWTPLTLEIESCENGVVIGRLNGIVLDITHLDFTRQTSLDVRFRALTEVGAASVSSCGP